MWMVREMWMVRLLGMWFAVIVVLISLGATMARADDDFNLDQFLASGFARYEPARFTQSIFTVTDLNTGYHGPRIDPVPRSRLEAKWQVPGGLVGVRGWKSDIYVKKGVDFIIYNNWPIPVKNGFGFYQTEVGFARGFADGAAFIDVLTNTRTGKIFEVRVAEKNDSKWSRFVDWRDRSQRPSGYRPPRARDCRRCHSETGTGGYAVGLVPGSDTVISYPFPQLEEAGKTGQSIHPRR